MKPLIRDKILTFLYLPQGSSEPRSFRVSRNLLVSLVVAVMGALGVSGAVILHYSNRLKDVYTLENLEARNHQLRGQLDEMNGEVDVLKRQVAQNFDFQKKARILANLDALDDDVAQVGIGGPELGAGPALPALDAGTRFRVEATRNDIEKLMRQARLQKSEYEKIVSRLESANQQIRTTPSLRPVKLGFVSSRFGWRMDPITGRRTMHRGVDFSARLGTPVIATADGVVTYSGVWQNYGNVVEISHGNGFVTRYAHLQRRLVSKGQRVTRGDVIGRVGSTGRSTFSHLHYEIEEGGERIDPMRFVLAN